MKDETKQELAGLIVDPLAQAGYELADVVLSHYKSNVTVRVFVYGSEGVTLDACARLSRLVGDVIEETELFADGYTLEVSSPGLDRPLKTARDFKYRVGETVKIEFVEKARKRLRAEIVSADDHSVTLKQGDEAVTIDLTDIEMAKIVF